MKMLFIVPFMRRKADKLVKDVVHLSYLRCDIPNGILKFKMTYFSSLENVFYNIKFYLSM